MLLVAQRLALLLSLVAATAVATTRDAVAAPQGPTRITTQLPAIKLPTSSLFNVHAEPTSRVLIETDPQFASYRVWISSDTLLKQLAAEPKVRGVKCVGSQVRGSGLKSKPHYFIRGSLTI